MSYTADIWTPPERIEGTTEIQNTDEILMKMFDNNSGGMAEYLSVELGKIYLELANTSASSALLSHIANIQNPHSVTASQLGVDSSLLNIDTLSLPLSTAVINALNGKIDKTSMSGSGGIPTMINGKIQSKNLLIATLDEIKNGTGDNHIVTAGAHFLEAVEYFIGHHSISSSAGAVDAYKTIATDANGKIHQSLIDIVSFTAEGDFTPTTAKEYPTDTDTSGGTLKEGQTFFVNGLASKFTFTTGSLKGDKVDNGAIMIKTSKGWSIQGFTSGSDLTPFIKLINGVYDLSAGGVKTKNISGVLVGGKKPTVNNFTINGDINEILIKKTASKPTATDFSTTGGDEFVVDSSNGKIYTNYKGTVREIGGMDITGIKTALDSYFIKSGATSPVSLAVVAPSTANSAVNKDYTDNHLNGKEITAGNYVQGAVPTYNSASGTVEWKVPSSISTSDIEQEIARHTITSGNTQLLSVTNEHLDKNPVLHPVVNVGHGLMQLDGRGKIPTSALNFKTTNYTGNYDATKALPTLGKTGDIKFVTKAGTQNIDDGSGKTNRHLNIGDQIISDGYDWLLLHHENMRHIDGENVILPTPIFGKTSLLEVLHHIQTKGVGGVTHTVSTASPSGGKNQDVWIVV